MNYNPKIPLKEIFLITNPWTRFSPFCRYRSGIIFQKNCFWRRCKV